MKGAPERILELCTHYSKEEKTAMLTAKEVDRIQKTVVQMSSKGLRGKVGPGSLLTFLSPAK